MVLSRKDKESYIGKNLSFLRKQKGKTLWDMANLLDLSGRSSYKAYEEERALPDIHKIMKLASFFDVSVSELVYQDIESMSGINHFEERRLFEISKVPVYAAAGYSQGFGDIGYIRSLKTIKIPFEPPGVARAFDISGDSMEPEINDGATVIGIRVSNSEIKDNKTYIIVTTEGVQCKHVRIEKESDVIYIISRNTLYQPKHIRKEDVMEMWEVWKTL